MAPMNRGCAGLLAVLGMLFLIGALLLGWRIFLDPGTPRSVAKAGDSTAPAVSSPIPTPTPTSQLGDSNPGGPAAPTRPPTAQAIVTFTAPATANCGTTQLPIMVHLTWSTANTTGVTISIDGPGKYGDYPASGAVDLPFACSVAQHTYLITTQGSGAPATKMVVIRRA